MTQKMVIISKPFVDFDGVEVEQQTILGSVVRRGYAQGRANYFWNITSSGRVVATTVGYPPHTHAKDTTK